MAEATQLRNFWYVVARSGDLRKTPLARKVCGRHLVVFRDGGGTARVLDAVCPHRGANLAHGRVVDGCIMCPYHGWRFDGDGRCTIIPANHEPTRVPPGYSTDSFPVIEQQGLIWTCVGKAVAPPPRYPELDDPALETFCYEVTAPLPFDWWVENALDIAHLPFVHEQTIGDERSTLDEFVIEKRADQLGFVARGESRQPHTILKRWLQLEMKVVITLDMPGNATFDVDLGKGRRQVILAIATPEDGHTTRTWNFSMRNFLRVPVVGNAVGWWFTRAVLKEDISMAARSLELLSVDRKGMLSSRSDELGLQFLRLLRLWRAREAMPVVDQLAQDRS